MAKAKDRILKREEVQAITGLARSTIYEKMSRKTFPLAVKLGERSIGWYESEVVEWIQNRPRIK